MDLSDFKFNYSGWRDDVEECEQQMIDGHISYAKMTLQSIMNKQLLHDGTCTDPNILRLESGEFDYTGFEEDKQVAMSLFRKGRDLTPEMIVFELKQKRSQGDHEYYNLHPILQEMDGIKFNYDGWEKHGRRIEQFLFDINPCKTSLVDREKIARSQLDQMKRCQLAHEEDDPVFNVLTSGLFNYPKFEEDMRSVLQKCEGGYCVKKFVDFMQLRQDLNDGKSHPLLNSLEENGGFTYDLWEVDAVELKKILFCSPICENMFCTPR